MDAEQETRLLVSRLPAATRKPVVTVTKRDSVARARTLMELHGFSQLPVVSGRNNYLKSEGVVTWQSIALGLLKNPQATLEECTGPKPREVGLDDDLLTAVPVINEVGYVVVVTSRGHLVGIVTSADVGEALVEIAGAYLDLSACERQLRLLVARCLDTGSLTEEEITSVVVRHGHSYTGEVEDLPLGILLDVARLSGVRRAIDRGHHADTLYNELSELAEARNAVMHFRRLSEASEVTLSRTRRLTDILRRISSTV